MVYRSLQWAHQICEGKDKEQYARLRNYTHKLLKANHESSIYLQLVLESHNFQKMYICFKDY